MCSGKLVRRISLSRSGLSAMLGRRQARRPPGNQVIARCSSVTLPRRHAQGTAATLGVCDALHLAAVHDGSPEIICLAACSSQTSSAGADA
jgi:hypothetical protein